MSLLMRRRMMMQTINEEVPMDIDLAEVYGVEVGVILNSNGTTTGWSPGIVSNFIPCKPDYLFELKITMNSWNKVCFYDENMSFISSDHLGTYSSGIFQFGKETSHVIPETVKYLRAQLKGQNEGSYYIKRIA